MLVKLMVMEEGLNFHIALALHYAVENCSRVVVKSLLELGAAGINNPTRPTGKTRLHLPVQQVNRLPPIPRRHLSPPSITTSWPSTTTAPSSLPPSTTNEIPVFPNTSPHISTSKASALGRWPLACDLH
ncbi:hypothetical protein NL676_032171 [Syzygium grande]|nr:hypothetical protein NL676_032171 [Syzygium grande]